MTFPTLHLHNLHARQSCSFPSRETRLAYSSCSPFRLPRPRLGERPTAERSTSSAREVGRHSLAAVVAPATSLALLVRFLMLLVLPGTWRRASADHRFVKEAVAAAP